MSGKFCYVKGSFMRWTSLLIVMGLVLSFGVLPMAYAEDEKIVISIGSISANPGDSIEVPVILKNVPSSGINSMSLNISYISSYLTVEKTSAGEIVKNPTELVVDAANDAIGVAFLGSGDGTTDITNDGLLFKIYIKVSENAPQGEILALRVSKNDKTGFFDNNYKEKAWDKNDGFITVKGSGTVQNTPTPKTTITEEAKPTTAVTSTPAATTTPKPTKKPGKSGGGAPYVKSSNANLKSLEVTNGKLDKDFTAANTSYEMVIDNASQGIQFKPVTEDSNAKVYIVASGTNGEAKTFFVTSGQSSGKLPLSVGVNNISIVVTAENGTTKQYDFKVSSSISVEAEKTPLANDVVKHWAKNYIAELLDKNIVTGYPDGTFGPDNKITRAEMAVILTKMIGAQPATNISFNFADNDSIAKWSKPYIQVAIDKGFMKGYSDNSFKPSNYLTRAEMSVIVIKVLGLEASSETTTSFNDNGSIANWSKGYIIQAVNEGLINGYPDNTFKPANNITRAEVSAVISNALNK